MTASEASPLFLDSEARAAAAAGRLVERLSGTGSMLALAESCTAGLVADLIARTSGASKALWGSFVCYSAGAKSRMLNIDGGFLERYGQVSRETARELALRALDLARVSFAAAVTGIAGPLGDGSGVPVGTVWIGVARRPGSGNAGEEGLCHEKEMRFSGTRAEIRM
ncbi:MAG: nicotinamide-nucleotide amidohydrolase family protein, partial [Treponema sp.]|nr:nicotinamide-nucleotide amidohydrolase family protein [Treponema sp.]